MPDFKDHFSENSAAYAQFRPTYPARTLDALCDGLAPCHLAWDAGCGSGQFSHVLGTRFDRVYATDPSANQIKEAARTSANITYACEPAERCSLGAQSVDAAVCAQAAHWFDLDAYYNEVRRVVRPQGRVALMGYANIVSEHRVAEVVSDIYSRLLGAYWPEERQYVENHYRDFAFPFREIKAPSLSIEVDFSKDALIGYVLSWSAVHAFEKQTGENARKIITPRITLAWADAEIIRFVWPLFMRLGVVE